MVANSATISCLVTAAAACGATPPPTVARPQPQAIASSQPQPVANAAIAQPAPVSMAREAAQCPPGGHLWCTAIAAGPSAVIRGLAAHPDNGWVVIGAFEGTIDLGGGPRVSRGGLDGFVLALGADGRYLWDRVLGSAGHDLPAGVVVDGSGSIVVTGGFNDALDFGGGLRRNAGGADAFVVALTREGKYLWDWTLSGPGYDFGRALALGRDGTLAVAGHYGDGTLFATSRGHHENTDKSSNVDGFVVALDKGGHQRWTWTLESSEWASLEAVVHDGTSFVVAGRAQGELRAHGIRPTEMDALIAKVSPSGRVAWIRVIGGPGTDVATTLAVTPSGETVVAGYSSTSAVSGFVHGLDATGATRWSQSSRDIPGWLRVSADGRLFAGDVQAHARGDVLVAMERSATGPRGVVGVAGFIARGQRRDLFVLATNEDIGIPVGPALNVRAR